MPETRLILHVKGTESETRVLPREVVKAAISEGEITHSQLIWSPENQTWKQVRELPHLLPSRQTAPAPTARPASAPVPRIVQAVVPESPANPVARAASTSPTAATPRVRVATAGAKTPTVRAAGPVLVRTTGTLEVKQEDGSHPLKWLCIGLGMFILLVVGGNYFLVDRPLMNSMSQSPYANVTVLGHFGAFMQPNVMIIHIPHSSKVNRSNLTDFFVALARCTPDNPISHDLFDRVAVTSGWTSKYSFSGGSWKELGDMQKESEVERREFIIDQMCDANGRPLKPESTLNEDMQKAMRDKAWNAFVDDFAPQN